ncbi:MAG: hypothetical protein ATN31_07925 [Candidatus Epulonipiscioides saccharophilum]|nr:MAG: hypothetical protein ATN31_07925 [Epulopiscium sp. AS2M-Bin001]
MHQQYYFELEKYEKITNETNISEYNGLLNIWQNCVISSDSIPLSWKYDLNVDTNPHFLQRLGVTKSFHSAAIFLNGLYYLIVSIKGWDNLNFFGLAQSNTGVSGFKFFDFPLMLEDTDFNEINLFDMRLTKHEDGYIYGLFSSESREGKLVAGIVRTEDLVTWERLPNLETKQNEEQTNVVLHPELVYGKYAFYTQPDKKGVKFGLCEDILNPVIENEEEFITKSTDYRVHESGIGIVPIKTDKGWIHISIVKEGSDNLMYAFATDLDDPMKIIAEPAGYLLEVEEGSTINGAAVDNNGSVFIYVANKDLRVVSITIDSLLDYIFNTPKNAFRSILCVSNRCEMIQKNLEIMDNSSSTLSTEE